MRRAPVKLRDMRIPSADGPDESLTNFNCVSGAVAVIFTHHAERLVSLIQQYDFAVGCVAWLTHPDILDALATRKQAQIVVQKEDFLRPDGGGASWKSALHTRYMRLRGTDRYDAPGRIHNMSMCGDSHVEGVRCMGMRGERTVPRMHHKFLVLGNFEKFIGPCESYKQDCWQCKDPDSIFGPCKGHKDHQECYECRSVWNPKCVWTGSFNFTQNAENSIENAVVIHDEKIAQAYLDEWSQVLALSEPCDWESEYVAPEWRIGT